MPPPALGVSFLGRPACFFFFPTRKVPPGSTGETAFVGAPAAPCASAGPRVALPRGVKTRATGAAIWGPELQDGGPPEAAVRQPYGLRPPSLGRHHRVRETLRNAPPPHRLNSALLWALFNADAYNCCIVVKFKRAGSASELVKPPLVPCSVRPDSLDPFDSTLSLFPCTRCRGRKPHQGPCLSGHAPATPGRAGGMVSISYYWPMIEGLGGGGMQGAGRLLVFSLKI